MTDVAIIGGGVGGLAVAYNLYKQATAGGEPVPNITIYEASNRIGGNADTVQFTFGTGPAGQVINRWADLGVNDFNTTAYTLIVEVMNTIGYKSGTNYKNLEDSTSYYTGDGSTYFTDSGNSWWGTQMDPKLQASVNSFMTQAGKDAESPKYHSYTLENYINEMTPTFGWDPRLGPQVIYPRVNGMYFVSELGPRNMPFAGVMHYYKIQEGAGGAAANRCYFVGGASTWIDALVTYMTRTMGIKFVPNFKAALIPSGNPRTRGWTIVNTADASQNANVDMAVLACHADDAAKAVVTGLPLAAANTLAQISYANSVAVAHTDSRLLPVNRNAWSTYNILIHGVGSVALKPYVINYVANRHQNDAANPDYDRFGLPEFFVSVNPQLPIPENMVLKGADQAPAIANLRHNLYDFACMDAQSLISAYQGVFNMYYAGGWTHGSGLHEECWQQGIDVASSILQHIKAGAPRDAARQPDTAKLITDRLAKSASSLGA